jgi:hypothetical protein
MEIAMLSRIQFGATAGFHIIFPSLIIGLMFYLVALEILWAVTGRQIYRAQFDSSILRSAASMIRRSLCFSRFEKWNCSMPC